MKLYDSKMYRDDISLVLKNNNFSFLCGKKLLITGGTGLIGSAIVDLIIANNEINNYETEVYVAARNQQKVDSRFGGSTYIKWVEYNALDPFSFDVKVDYIIHGAGNASPELYLSQPVETMLMNFNALNDLLNYSKNNKVKKLVYISSSEVYGKKTTEDPYSENDYGYIDILKTRSSYSISKRASETLCKAYLDEYGVGAVIVRPGHIFGPTASIKDGRISSDFAFKSANGIDLIMKSSGLQKRSYMYCLDCAGTILRVLERGDIGEAYNICNKDVITIKEMANQLAIAGKVKLSLKDPTQDELIAFNPMNNSSLDWEKVEKLGYNNNFSVDEGLRHTVQILKEIISSTGEKGDFK
jgi:nucleoside-diphosphate-sugar epimerase